MDEPTFLAAPCEDRRRQRLARPEWLSDLGPIRRLPLSVPIDWPSDRQSSHRH
jgi:hypothetical protein